jgi:hypothetical protein
MGTGAQIIARDERIASLLGASHRRPYQPRGANQHGSKALEQPLVELSPLKIAQL